MNNRYDDYPIDPNCAAQHIAHWMIEPTWFAQAVAAVKDGTWEIRSFMDDKPEKRVLYVIDSNGIAIIPLVGPLMKGDSKFGGTTSTVRTRRAVRMATQDSDVRGIMLHIDSPGGTVSGTAELAADVKLADDQKPVHAFIDDLGASAAYWVASQARRVSANATAEVGSIGVVAVVEDSSGQAEAEGIKVHVIATGPFKGAFVDGTEVTPDHLAYLQQRVDEINGHFLRAISKGRKMSMAEVRKAADGRVFGAAVAQEMGLIDAVQRMDKALADLTRDTKNAGTPRRDRASRNLRLSEA